MRADDRSETIQAGAQLADAANQAREKAVSGYRASQASAGAGAVTCANGYPCTDNRLDRFEGLADALSEHLQLMAAVSLASAAYVEAVGVDGARDRGGRIRRLAGRLRDVDAAEAMDRWNGLVGELGEEVEAATALHRRAVEVHANGTRTLFDDVNEVLEAVTASAARPPTDAAARHAVLRAAQAADNADAGAEPDALGRAGEAARAVGAADPAAIAGGSETHGGSVCRAGRGSHNRLGFAYQVAFPCVCSADSPDRRPWRSTGRS